MTLLIAVVSVCLFMFFQDIFGTSMMISESRGLKFFPGFFDALGDYVNKYGAAVVAVTAVHWGLWSWETLVVVTACAITSFFTSNFATGKASLVLPQTRMEKVTLADILYRLKDSFGKSGKDGGRPEAN